jgi:hypothetical protein
MNIGPEERKQIQRSEERFALVVGSAAMTIWILFLCVYFFGHCGLQVSMTKIEKQAFLDKCLCAYAEE